MRRTFVWPSSHSMLRRKTEFSPRNKTRERCYPHRDKLDPGCLTDGCDDFGTRPGGCGGKSAGKKVTGRTGYVPWTKGATFLVNSRPWKAER